jgi:hypothetical protein
MLGRGIRYGLVFLLILSMFSLVIAEDNVSEEDRFQTDWDGTCGDFDCEELDLKDGGIGPDHLFYFLDEFFDRFGDELEVKEEKVAEIKEMIENGNFDAARDALKHYKKYAQNLEKEIDPEKAEKAKKSSAAIEEALRELEGQIPEEDKAEFFDDILESEDKIVVSSEIASKIKELCQSLAELDPLQYSKICKSDDDAPRWKRDLDEDLTKDQKKIAKDFIKIMSQCFKTSGQECSCEDIPFPDFSKACIAAAPLATACDIEGDEESCDKLDSLEMPELPDYLQEIFDEMEGDMNEAQFEMHMPRECVEAGATTPKECSKVMITKHAPEECREALLEADVQSEKEGRAICDAIMMQKHAPECAEEGIANPEECKDFMWNIDNRPEECQENDIHDFRDCKKFM